MRATVAWRRLRAGGVPAIDARALLATLPARLGLPGGMGLALLAWAAWLTWVELPAREAETAALQTQTRQARRALWAAARTASQRPATPQQTLAAVQSRLAGRADRAPALADVLERARTAGLQVQSAAYRVQPAALAGVLRHEVALPVRGDYAAVRGWLADVLAQQPALSLDGLSLKRTDAQAGIVEARVSWSLWVRQDAAPASPAPVAPTDRGTASMRGTASQASASPAGPAAASARIDGWPADRTLVARQSLAQATSTPAQAPAAPGRHHAEAAPAKPGPQGNVPMPPPTGRQAEARTGGVPAAIAGRPAEGRQER